MPNNDVVSSSIHNNNMFIMMLPSLQLRGTSSPMHDVQNVLQSYFVTHNSFSTFLCWVGPLLEIQAMNLKNVRRGILHLQYRPVASDKAHTLQTRVEFVNLALVCVYYPFNRKTHVEQMLTKLVSHAHEGANHVWAGHMHTHSQDCKSRSRPYHSIFI